MKCSLTYEEFVSLVKELNRLTRVCRDTDKPGRSTCDVYDHIAAYARRGGMISVLREIGLEVTFDTAGNVIDIA